MLHLKFEYLLSESLLLRAVSPPPRLRSLRVGFHSLFQSMESRAVSGLERKKSRERKLSDLFKFHQILCMDLHEGGTYTAEKSQSSDEGVPCCA